jgi:hypothetical protein
MTSTIEHVASGDVERMTANELRYHLTRARQRIASLVRVVDDLRSERATLRARVRRLEGQRRAVVAIVSDSGGRFD